MKNTLEKEVMVMIKLFRQTAYVNFTAFLSVQLCPSQLDRL